MLFAVGSLALLLAEGAAEGKENQPGLGLLQFLPLVLIFVFFYFFMIRAPMKRQEKERQSLFSNLKKNQRVVTSGGIIGILVSVNDKDDEAVLKVDESSNVRLRVLKSSIVRIVNPDENKDQKEGGGQS
jgi:preprotein translocase subunit YajC